MSTVRTVITVTPLYPGIFFAEDDRPIEIPDADPRTALSAIDDDGLWFALLVKIATQKRWMDGDGNEIWQPVGELSRYRIYIGEELTAADIERLNDGHDYSILLSNMRGNDWGRVVRTRRGNFQPVDSDDVVISTTDVS